MLLADFIQVAVVVATMRFRVTVWVSVPRAVWVVVDWASSATASRGRRRTGAIVVTRIFAVI